MATRAVAATTSVIRHASAAILAGVATNLEANSEGGARREAVYGVTSALLWDAVKGAARAVGTEAPRRAVETAGGILAASGAAQRAALRLSPAMVLGSACLALASGPRRGIVRSSALGVRASAQMDVCRSAPCRVRVVYGPQVGLSGAIGVQTCALLGATRPTSRLGGRKGFSANGPAVVGSRVWACASLGGGLALRLTVAVARTPHTSARVSLGLATRAGATSGTGTAKSRTSYATPKAVVTGRRGGGGASVRGWAWGGGSAS